MSLNLVVLVRSTMAFFVLVIYARILGKQQISQLTFFDYVNGITIGSIAATMSTDLGSLAFHHWIGLTVWTVLTILLHVISTFSRRWAKIIEGEPTVVIHNGKILEKNMRKLRYPYTDLMQQLRQEKVFDLGDVEFALLEPNGELSVLKKTQKQPLTPEDLSIPTKYQGLATELIIDGQVQHQNLRDLDKTEKWLREKLKEQGIPSSSKVSYASLGTDGNLYVDLRKDNLGKKTKNPSDFEGPQ